MVANHIHSLICSTYGHTLVLFTSYTLMGSVYQILRDSLPFPMVEVWRHSQEEILRFKTMENGVLFAAGSCWEGVDFPGDMVSSLIIVKLPFAVPDPISEAEKETYDSLETYIQSIIVPDMQKKLAHNLPSHPVVMGTVTISEGRKRQIRRMLKVVGCCVIRLKRVSMGDTVLDDTLNPGDYREFVPEPTIEK